MYLCFFPTAFFPRSLFSACDFFRMRSFPIALFPVRFFQVRLFPVRFFPVRFFPRTTIYIAWVASYIVIVCCVGYRFLNIYLMYHQQQILYPPNMADFVMIIFFFICQETTFKTRSKQHLVYIQFGVHT